MSSTNVRGRRFDWEQAGPFDEGEPDFFLASVAATCINPHHPWHDSGDWFDSIASAVNFVMDAEDLGQTLARLFLRLSIELDPERDIPDEWRDWAYYDESDWGEVVDVPRPPYLKEHQ